MFDSDFIVINCSEDGNIDTLRTKIRNFASTVSIAGGKKVVILLLSGGPGCKTTVAKAMCSESR